MNDWRPEGCTCPQWGNPNWPHRNECPAAQDDDNLNSAQHMIDNPAQYGADLHYVLVEAQARALIDIGRSLRFLINSQSPGTTTIGETNEPHVS